MASKKGILFVVEAMGGGVFTYIVDLANELVNAYDMYIAYAAMSQTTKNCNEYFSPAFHLIEIKNFTRSINLLKDLRAISKVKRIAKEVKPENVHLHSSKSGVIGRITFNGKVVPLRYSSHGNSFAMENYKPTKRAMFHMIKSMMARRNCTTISCSPSEHQETLKLTKRATYVSNYINTAELDKMLVKVEKVDHPFIVFTLRRICFQKNPKLLNEIADAMPETKFLWIGGGELRDELKSSYIELTGWVDREKALQLSMNADVLLLSSLWEGLPISLFESMYMKKNSVVDDVIGSHDVIHNEVDGFVCRTVDEFRNDIQTQESSTLIEPAFNDIAPPYNTSVMGEKYAEIYEGGGVHELVFLKVYGLIAVSENGIGLWSSAGEAVVA